jgi:hypothetical protein
MTPNPVPEPAPFTLASAPIEGIAGTPLVVQLKTESDLRDDTLVVTMRAKLVLTASRAIGAELLDRDGVVEVTADRLAERIRADYDDVTGRRALTQALRALVIATENARRHVIAAERVTDVLDGALDAARAKLAEADR